MTTGNQAQETPAAVPLAKAHDDSGFNEERVYPPQIGAPQGSQHTSMGSTHSDPFDFRLNHHHMPISTYGMTTPHPHVLSAHPSWYEPVYRNQESAFAAMPHLMMASFGNRLPPPHSYSYPSMSSPLMAPADLQYYENRPGDIGSSLRWRSGRE